MTGRIHSIQSLGTVDGPGVRFVAFMAGCPLRCKCCHNPEIMDGKEFGEYQPQKLVDTAARFLEYFGERGGVTLSGGEPLLQPEFAAEYFRLCHERGINTCLDTSGCLMNEAVRVLLSHTDRVLLDIKYTNDADYRENAGCSIVPVLSFLEELERRQIPTTLRQVIIPTVNDTEESVRILRDIALTHACVDGVELLPFRKYCQVKYDKLGIPFPFGHLPEPTEEKMAHLRGILGEAAEP